MTMTDVDQRHMQRALRMAMRGQGFVEPNPMVGCVIAQGDTVLADGWHRQFGGPHAEVNALSAAGTAVDLTGATLYVTLEPCAHHGKTPPCVQAILESGIPRVVIAHVDPHQDVSGRGIEQLRSAGRKVQVGLLENAARQLNAPYHKRLATGRPWVLAKWAMTLDGKIATRTGSSQWITNSESRERAHQLRGRVDAIIVGRNTIIRDDPALTARPPGPRTATRVAVDSRAQIALDSELVKTAGQTPTMIVVGPAAPSESCTALEKAGCAIVTCSAADPNDRLEQMLEELGNRQMTNVLIEGGGQLLGSFLDRHLVDEAHIFVAPKIIGGHEAVSAVAGTGVPEVEDAWRLQQPAVEILNDNVYVHGRLTKETLIANS